MLIDALFCADDRLGGASFAARGLYAHLWSWARLVGTDAFRLDGTPRWSPALRPVLEELLEVGAVHVDGEVVRLEPLVRARAATPPPGAPPSSRLSQDAELADACELIEEPAGPAATAGSETEDERRRRIDRERKRLARSRGRAGQGPDTSADTAGHVRGHGPDTSTDTAGHGPDMSADSAGRLASQEKKREQREEVKAEDTLRTRPRTGGGHEPDTSADSAGQGADTGRTRAGHVRPAVSTRPLGGIADDGLLGHSVEHYAAAVGRHTGAPYRPTGSDHRELVDVLNGHALGLRGDALLRWIDDVLDAFHASGAAQFGGYRPRILLRWLNDGRPDKRRATGARPPPRLQPAPPAPWLAKANPTRTDDEEAC